MDADDIRGLSKIILFNPSKLNNLWSPYLYDDVYTRIRKDQSPVESSVLSDICHHWVSGSSTSTVVSEFEVTDRSLVTTLTTGTSNSSHNVGSR